MADLDHQQGGSAVKQQALIDLRNMLKQALN